MGFLINNILETTEFEVEYENHEFSYPLKKYQNIKITPNIL